jgi:hypothetical protein
MAAALTLPMQIALAEDNLPDLGMRIFYPAQSEGDKLYETSGVITTYAYGRRAGNLTLLSHGDQQQLFLPRYGTLIIAGHHVKCDVAPFNGFKSRWCHDWPSSIVLNKTNVYVRYFVRSLDGQLVKVAGDIQLTP